MVGDRLHSLLAPVSESSPSGPSLEFEPEFNQLERDAEGTPERRMGDAVQPEIPPDWKGVRRTAEALLTRSKDIQVALYWCRSRIAEDGLVGFAEGLTLLEEMLERFWPTIHPELDTEDDDDPTMRINAIGELNDYSKFINPIRNTPVINSRVIGRFVLRDVLAAALPNPPEGTPDNDLIRSAFKGVADNGEFLVADRDIVPVAEAIDVACNSLGKIANFLADKVGYSRTADLGAITSLMKDASRVVGRHMAERRGGNRAENLADGVGQAVAPESTHGAGQGVGHGGAVVAVASGAAGEVGSREDVGKLIDMICEFYAKAEPSSPVPYLLVRAKRMIGKNFVDLLDDLAPEGARQFEVIRGPTV